jgi:hypothetical protein
MNSYSPWHQSSDGLKFTYIHTYIHTVTECGVLSWPWQWFALGQLIIPWFLTANRYIPVRDTLDWSAVVFCACETKQLFAVVFCVVRAVHNLTLGLLQTKHLTNGEPVFVKCTKLYSDRHPRFWTGSVRFSPRVLRDCTHSMQVICILLSKEFCIHTLYLSTILVFDKWRQTADDTE